MIRLKDVTLVCVDGRGDLDCLRSLLYSSQEIEFGRVILFTALDEGVCGLIHSHYPGIDVIRLNPFDFAGYGIWLLHQLHAYIQTSHVLITQDDGFVINPECWDPRFLEYDYVGAPWTNRHHYRNVRVGNGGFSLRSLRLLQATCRIPEDKLRKFPYEDHLICISFRDLFEGELGFKFAPIEIAKYFSREKKIEENIPWTRVFGFHGRYNESQMIRLTEISLDGVFEGAWPLIGARDSFPILSPKV